ncbi:unnamed protein product, partial [Ectocarpus sp. 12 AP-2014]
FSGSSERATDPRRHARETHLSERMKSALATMAVSATAASFASAFVRSPLPLRALTSRPSCSTSAYRARPTRMTAEDDEVEPKVYYASEVTDGNKKTTFNREMGEQPLPENTAATRSDRYGPADYEGFVDSEGFDGGDGQVGVVGDGGNAMEQFDQSAVGRAQDMKAKVKASTMVQESKARQRNAWGGGSTGYADELKEQGMVSYNAAGEDTSKVRRQQYENYRNQQEITRRQRADNGVMEAMTGTGTIEDNTSKWKRGGRSSYFDNINAAPEEAVDQSWNKYSAPVASGMKDGTEWGETTLTGNEKVEDTVQCISTSGRPGHATLNVKSTVMTFEPFHCTFVGDARGFKVTPEEGTLNRRGGDPQELDVSYMGNGPGDNRIGTLVVETEEDKWIYKV